ncbi:MAG: signal peptidase I [Thermoanaerobaculia bacterium]
MGPDVHAGPLTGGPETDAVSARTPALRSRARDFAEAILVAVILALFVRTFLLQAYAVPTPSMEDNILVGDHLIVNKFLYAPSRFGALSGLLPRRRVLAGDVFVFKFPEDPRRDFVKRAIALPGDLLEIRDKVVYVNQAPLAEPAVTHADRNVYAAGRRDQFGPIRVPEGHIFALGDNRDSSNDSRFWGTVPTANVKGRALLVYWSAPPAPPGRNLLRRVADFFTRTRWERTFRPVR